MNIKSNYKKMRQRYRPVKSTKAYMSKKKNQRKVFVIAATAVTLILLGLLIFNIWNSKQERRELESRLNNQSSTIETLDKKLDNFQRVEARQEKIIQEKDAVIKKKTTEEKKLKKEVDNLNNQLHTKAQREKAQEPVQLASVVEYGESGGRGSVASQAQSVVNVGNKYAPGNCTWYVYNRKPNIGSFWGDASQWISSAQRDGFGTGSEPVAGAIGVEKGISHVVVVESVNPDSTVTISEMNYGGLYNMNTRTVHKSTFFYIYA